MAKSKSSIFVDSMWAGRNLPVLSILAISKNEVEIIPTKTAGSTSRILTFFVEKGYDARYKHNEYLEDTVVIKM